MKKNLYKKIFVIGTALFLVFAPVGITMNSGVSQGLNPAPFSALATQGAVEGSLLSPSPLHLSFNFNFAEATTTTGAFGGTVAVQQPNFYDCVTSPATCGVFYVSLVANGAAGLFLTIGAFLVRLGLQFNDNIFNSPAVLTGFSVSLAIANLGFVLGIIIIAIATIIRNQTYGIKQLLWKLVMMAVLVNFGLVITAPIVGFANNLSTYFVDATSPSAATGGYEAYVSTLMTAFNPQVINEFTAASSTASTSNGGFISGLCKSLLTYIPGPWAMCKLAGQPTSSSPSDNFWQSTMALLFDIVFSAIAAFTFLCLAILLIIRYLILGGLLIVLPLAWLTYIFPRFDNSFSKWWNTFLKWTFFPPLALFFIYLAFITAVNMGTTSQLGQTQAAYFTSAVGNQNDTIEAALAKEIGPTGSVGSVIAQTADEILLVGLMIMGLMFANSLAGKAGSTVVNGATTASKAAAGYVGRKGKRLAGDRLRTMGQKYNPETRETTSSLQRLGSRLQGIPIVGALGGRAVGSSLANYAAPKAVGAERKADIEKYTKESLANIDNKGLLALANLKTSTINPTHAAAIAQELAKRDLISRLDDKTQKKYLHHAENMGTSEAVYNNRPDLVELRDVEDPVTHVMRKETKEEAMARAIGSTKGEVVNVNAQVFNYTHADDAIEKLGLQDANGRKLDRNNPADVDEAKKQIRSAVLKLTPAQLGALGSDQSAGSQARQNNLTEAIKDVILNIPNIKKPILGANGQPTGKFELDNGQLQNYITTRRNNGASKTELEGLANIEKIVKHMESSPNWGSVLN